MSNPKNTKISTKVSIPTIVLESCSKCEVEVPEGWTKAMSKGSLYTCLSEDISITCNGKSFKVDILDTGEEKEAVSQFISRFLKEGFRTEKVIREGGGYATTKREKDLADEKERRQMEKLNQHMSSSINISSKTSQTSSKAPRPNGLMRQISTFSKSEKLKPTETRVSTIPVVPEKPLHGREDNEIKQLFDEEWEMEEKVKLLAEMIRNAKHVVVYTGAGISTSAKIPDYRGPQGVWTLQDQGVEVEMDSTLKQALPTVTK